jgi:hypothetical protein
VFRIDEQLDASGDAGLASDQAGSLESEDHLMNGWWADAEVALHVGFGGRASEHARIGIDEGQVLALRFSEALGAGAASGA